MRVKRLVLLMTVSALALASVAAGCGSTSRGGAGGATSTSAQLTPTTQTVPSTSSTSAPAPSTSVAATTTVPTGRVDVRVYFMHGDYLAVGHRSIQSAPRVAAAALTQLLAGPTTAESAAGLATAVPTGTRLLDVGITGRIATVDLSSAFASGGGSLSMVGRLAQVTFTLTQFPTVEGVVFRLDGKPVSVFGGEGIVLDHPATRSSFESVTPPILVEFPGRGWTVRSPFTVSGTANVFEAQFGAELRDGAGRLITERSIVASSGTGTRGTFSATVVFPTSSAGPATLTVFDISPRDGSHIDVVTVPLVLAAT